MIERYTIFCELRMIGILFTSPHLIATADRMLSEEYFTQEIHRHIFRRILARGSDAALAELNGLPQIATAIRLAMEFPPGRDMPPF